MLPYPALAQFMSHLILHGARQDEFAAYAKLCLDIPGEWITDEAAIPLCATSCRPWRPALWRDPRESSSRPSNATGRSCISIRRTEFEGHTARIL